MLLEKEYLRRYVGGVWQDIFVVLAIQMKCDKVIPEEDSGLWLECNPKIDFLKSFLEYFFVSEIN